MKQFFRISIITITVLTVCLLGVTTVFSVSPDSSYFLAETPDAGLDYQNALVFMGESTTAHLKSRGVLTDGTDTVQIWANESGTMCLSPKLLTQTILYPKTGERLTVAQAVAIEQPAYLVLSFGLNGIVGFAKDTNRYLDEYQKLIDVIHKESPNTAIIIQTVYPVAAPKKDDDWHFSESPRQINQKINLVNDSLSTLAKSNERVMIADTASILKNENGMLCAKYDTGDGIHLTSAAYEQILHYLRTHAYHSPTPLPLPKDYWRN